MAAEKVASVKLLLNARGYLSSMRSLDRSGSGVAARLAGRFSMVGAKIREWVKEAGRMARAVKGVAFAVTSNPYGSMLSGLRALESKSVSAFKRIGAAAKSAYGAALKWNFERNFNVDKAGKVTRKQKQSMQVGDFAKEAARDVLLSMATKGLDLVTKANSVAEQAAQLSVNARAPGGARIDPKQLEAEAYAVTQTVKGTSASDAISAMAKFTALTGDLDTARQSLTTFATASRATGAEMGDIAESVASVSKQFGITDPEQIRQVLGALVGQGKAGAVELPELAAGLQRGAAAGAAFGLSRDVGGVRKLGGITQIARSGTGSSEQAFTAVESVFKALLSKSDEFKRAGVRVYEGKGANKKTRAIDDVLVDAISKMGGADFEKKNALLTEKFGDEGIRAINPLTSIYKTAFQGASGTNEERTAAGVAALRKALDDSINSAGTWADVVEDAATMQETNSAKLGASWEGLVGKVSDQVLPRFSDLIDKLTESGDAIDLFVTGLELMADMANDFAALLKELGLLKDRPKSSFEMRDEEQAKADAARAEMRAMGITPEEIGPMGAMAEAALTPEQRARREKGKALDLEAAKSELGAAFWDKKGKTDPQPWDDERGPTKRMSKLQKKFDDQRAAEREQAAPWTGMVPGAQAAPAAQGPGPWAPRGPIETRPSGTQRVHIVSDDTSRGAGAPAVTPGRAARP